jgi:hypothetical protein
VRSLVCFSASIFGFDSRHWTLSRERFTLSASSLVLNNLMASLNNSASSRDTEFLVRLSKSFQPLSQYQIGDRSRFAGTGGTRHLRPLVALSEKGSQYTRTTREPVVPEYTAGKRCCQRRNTTPSPSPEGAGRNRRTEDHLTLQTTGPAPPGKPDEAFGRYDGSFPVRSSISRPESETCRL